MGEVIAFRNAARRSVSTAPPRGEAQILFFLGVRYVRHDEDAGGGANAPENVETPRRSRSSSTRTRRRKRA